MPFLPLVAALLAAGSAIPVGLDPLCADYRAIRQQLGTRYGEAPISLGLQSDGNLLQVFASARTGTWTMITTAPSGRACILAAGRGWEERSAPSPDPAA